MAPAPVQANECPEVFSHWVFECDNSECYRGFVARDSYSLNVVCSHTLEFRDLTDAELEELTGFARARSVTGVSEVWARDLDHYLANENRKRRKSDVGQFPELRFLQDDWLELRGAWRGRVDRAEWSERKEWLPWYGMLAVIGALMLRATWSLATDGDELNWLMLIAPTLVLFGVGFSFPGWSGLRLLAVVLVPLGLLAMVYLLLLRATRRHEDALREAETLDELEELSPRGPE